MEEALDTDLRGVRLHTDTLSDRMNQELHAEAFTSGRHIFFRRGAYAPGSSRGHSLLAHELTHVVQQRGADITRGTIQRKMEFRSEQLKKDEKLLEAPQGQEINELFEKIARNLKHYENAWTEREELPRLQKLEILAMEWLGTLSASTVLEVQKVTVQIRVMLPKVRAEIDALGKERARQYLARVPATARHAPPLELINRAEFAERNSSLIAKLPRAGAHFRYITETGSQAMWQFTSKHKTALKTAKKLGLTEDELIAIRVLTGGDYRYINPIQIESEVRLNRGIEVLAKRGQGSEGWFAQDEARLEAQEGGSLRTRTGRRKLIVEALQHSRQALSGLNKLPDAAPTTAYRGTKVTLADFQAKYQKDCIVPSENYWVSTSLDPDQGLMYAEKNPREGFEQVLLVMQVTKGKDIQDLSLYKEKEILVPPGAQFKVTKDPVLITGKKVHRVEMSQIDAGSSSATSSASSSNSSMNAMSSSSSTSTAASSNSSMNFMSSTAATSTSSAPLPSPPTTTMAPYGTASSTGTSTSTSTPGVTQSTTDLTPKQPARARAMPTTSLPVFVLKEPLGGLAKETWIQLLGVSDDEPLAKIKVVGSDVPMVVDVSELELAIGRKLLRED